MRTVLYTNSNWSLPLLIKLEQQNMLGGIVLTSESREAHYNIDSFARSKNIPLIKVSKGSVHTELVEFLKSLTIEIGLSLAFPYLLPVQVIEIPSYGTFNYHFGSLPEYGGADPLFWTIKNQERTAILTIHKMTDKIDNGPELLREQLTIFPGENYGLLGARLSQAAVQSHDKLLEKVSVFKPFVNETKVTMHKRPTQQELTIDWQNQTSEQIEALVNAANPAYGGAITYFRGSMIWVLEVSPAEVSNTALLGPGSVVHADQQNGVFVLCSDYRYLRINIIRTPECILTGNKLAALGLNSGEKLGLNQVNSGKSKIII